MLSVLYLYNERFEYSATFNKGTNYSDPIENNMPHVLWWELMMYRFLVPTYLLMLVKDREFKTNGYFGGSALSNKTPPERMPNLLAE